eukprot:COSAG05_NODE_639_length_8156_cov_122.162840_5_plen_159_part_00
MDCSRARIYLLVPEGRVRRMRTPCVFDTTRCVCMRTQPAHGSATGGNAALPQQRVREEEGGAFPYVIIRNARIQSICKSQSCMVSKTDREEEGEGGGRSRGTREKLLRAALQLAATRLRYAAEVDPESWPLQVRVALIGHFSPCVTEIYIHIRCARGR